MVVLGARIRGRTGGCDDGANACVNVRGKIWRPCCWEEVSEALCGGGDKRLERYERHSCERRAWLSGWESSDCESSPVSEGAIYVSSKWTEVYMPLVGLGRGDGWGRDDWAGQGVGEESLGRLCGEEDRRVGGELGGELGGGVGWGVGCWGGNGDGLWGCITRQVSLSGL